MLQNPVSSFYMTLQAYDYGGVPGTLYPKTFQVRVDEKIWGSLDMTVSVARTTNEGDLLFFFLSSF